MLGAILGDIAGSRFKFESHISEDFDLLTRDCRFTGDTVMTLAIAEAVIDSRKPGTSCEIDRQALGKNAVRSARELSRLYPFCAGSRPFGNFSTETAARVSAVAEISTGLDQVTEMARSLISGIGNCHDEGSGGEVIAVAAFLARGRRFSKEEVRGYLEINYPECDRNAGLALEAFYASDGFEDAVRRAVRLDEKGASIAVMTGIVAEAYYGVPARLQEMTLSFLDSRLIGIYEKFLELKGIKYLDDPKQLDGGAMLLHAKGDYFDHPKNRSIISELCYCLRDSIVRVPGQAVMSDRERQVLADELRSGSEIEADEEIFFDHDIVNDDQGGRYFPVFSNDDQMPENYREELSVIDMPFCRCVEIARERGLTGLMLDPFTEEMPIGARLAEYIECLDSRIRFGRDERELKEDVRFSVDEIMDIPSTTLVAERIS